MLEGASNKQGDKAKLLCFRCFADSDKCSAKKREKERKRQYALISLAYCA